REVIRNAPDPHQERQSASALQSKELSGRITPHAYVRLAVTVIIALSDQVRAGESELIGEKVAIRALLDVPGERIGRGRAFADNRKIRLTVAVIIAGNNKVVRQAEEVHEKAAVAGPENVIRRLCTCRCSRTLDREVEFAVAVIIARCDIIGREAELARAESAVGASEDVPDHRSVRTSYDSEIGLAVAVIIACNGFIARDTELNRRERTIGAVEAVPYAGRIAPDGNICLAVAIKIARFNEVFVGKAEVLIRFAAAGLADVPGIITGPDDSKIYLAVGIKVESFA